MLPLPFTSLSYALALAGAIVIWLVPEVARGLRWRGRNGAATWRIVARSPSR